jgi:hypothetical protein
MTKASQAADPEGNNSPAAAMTRPTGYDTPSTSPKRLTGRGRVPRRRQVELTVSTQVETSRNAAMTSTTCTSNAIRARARQSDGGPLLGFGCVALTFLAVSLELIIGVWARPGGVGFVPGIAVARMISFGFVVAMGSV